MANGHVIMSETLPTIVGMGVVSRAVDTTMGRRSKRGRKAKRAKGRVMKIHRGPRGGKYIIKRGRRIYI